MEQFQAENAILAFVDDTLSTEEAKALQSMIERVPTISKITFISKQEAFDVYTEQYGEAASTVQLASSGYKIQE